MNGAGRDVASQAAALVRRKALDLLARREHSRQELRTKLLARSADRAAVEAVLDALQREGLQSEVRFAAALVRSRVGRGQGPVRIRQELRQRGVAEAIAESALDEEGGDWFALACAVVIGKFGETETVDRRELARRLRFLQYRGFTAEQCREALGL